MNHYIAIQVFFMEYTIFNKVAKRKISPKNYRYIIP